MKARNWRGVSAVIMPEAAISWRHFGAQAAAGPSLTDREGHRENARIARRVHRSGKPEIVHPASTSPPTNERNITTPLAATTRAKSWRKAWREGRPFPDCK